MPFAFWLFDTMLGDRRSERKEDNSQPCRPPNTYPQSRRMLVASLPGIRRASGSVPVTADVRKQYVASLPEYDLQADSIPWNGSPFATNNMAGP